MSAAQAYIEAIKTWIDDDMFVLALYGNRGEVDFLQLPFVDNEEQMKHVTTLTNRLCNYWMLEVYINIKHPDTLMAVYYLELQPCNWKFKRIGLPFNVYPDDIKWYEIDVFRGTKAELKKVTGTTNKFIFRF